MLYFEIRNCPLINKDLKIPDNNPKSLAQLVTNQT